MFVPPICKCGQIQVPLQQPQPIPIHHIHNFRSVPPQFPGYTFAKCHARLFVLHGRLALKYPRAGWMQKRPRDKLLANRLLEPHSAHLTVRKTNRHAGSGWALPKFAQVCFNLLQSCAMHACILIILSSIKSNYTAKVFRHIWFLDGNMVLLAFSCDSITIRMVNIGKLVWNHDIKEVQRASVKVKVVEGSIHVGSCITPASVYLHLDTCTSCRFIHETIYT